MLLLASFRNHLAVLGLEPGRALVAVSGGPDSIALLDLLVASRDAHGLELIVAHADHGIHPESGAVATRVEALAAGLGLPCVIGHLGLGPAAGETAARTARYAWLERVRAEQAADLVFTAHHADDQVETVLMRALSGSGPAGLAAMSAHRGRLVRPLLPFRRAQLVQYLHSRSLTGWDDPANADPRHLRSWLRGTLLPLIRARLPDVDRQLLSLARQARLDREAWDQLLDQLPELDWKSEPEGGSVAGAVLGRYDSPLAETLLRVAARRTGCVLGPRRAALALDFARSASSGATLELGGSW
ncbi:MAG: tRNA lysidine(34) synthetase TilS, partial [Gemmatimonadales bacterium]